ncbi:MAG: hypothetical protein QOJ34_1503, partial [Pseudonocardiales bacterium]|nr:hypothetical protein [Pseudonocardiales bacterium]
KRSGGQPGLAHDLRAGAAERRAVATAGASQELDLELGHPPRAQMARNAPSVASW